MRMRTDELSNSPISPGPFFIITGAAGTAVTAPLTICLLISVSATFISWNPFASGGIKNTTTGKKRRSPALQHRGRAFTTLPAMAL
jgi:hypothetical protein